VDLNGFGYCWGFGRRIISQLILMIKMGAVARSNFAPQFLGSVFGSRYRHRIHIAYGYTPVMTGDWRDILKEPGLITTGCYTQGQTPLTFDKLELVFAPFGSGKLTKIFLGDGKPLSNFESFSAGQTGLTRKFCVSL